MNLGYWFVLLVFVSVYSDEEPQGHANAGKRTDVNGTMQFFIFLFGTTNINEIFLSPNRTMQNFIGLKQHPRTPELKNSGIRHTTCVRARRMGTCNFRERYWFYSLCALIVGCGAAVFIELIPLLGGLLGAVTIYVLLRHQMIYLADRRKWRRSLAAALLLGEAIVCFLVPFSLFVWMLVTYLQLIIADPNLLLDPLKGLAELLHERTGYDLLREDNIARLVANLPRMGQQVVSGIVNFGIDIAVLLFVLYFMLIGGLRMENYCRDLLPFSRPVARRITGEVYKIVRANAIGVPLLALAQGFAAYVGYLIFGAPAALLWGVVSCVATVIPLVGAALVWVPLALYLFVEARWGAGIGLLVYGAIVITQVDNVVRFIMQKRLADTHPLVTIFGVVVGLALFGFMGVVFGPLLLAMLIFFVDFFKRRYIDGVPVNQLYLPDGTDA